MVTSLPTRHSGNPTVRHYRGASRTVRHGETVNPSRNRKSGNGNPSPTARRARSLSQPSASCEARSAPRSYPTVSRRQRRPRSVHSDCMGCLSSHEIDNNAGAEAVKKVEGNMCGTAMRGAVALPGSKNTSRAKGIHRKLGDPAFGQRQCSALVRIGKVRNHSR